LFQAGGTPVRNWRVLTAVAAVVLAAAASVLAYTYLTQADARAQDKTELVPALVARSVIPKGTPGKSAVDEGLFTTKRVPRDAVPDSVLTSDRGLCGAFNTNINKRAEREWRTRAANGQDVKMVIVGRKGRDYMTRRSAPILAYLPGVWDNLGYDTAKVVGDAILAPFNKKEVDAIYLVYNEFKSAMTQMVVTERLLPVAPRDAKLAADADLGDKPPDFLFEPNREALLERLVPMYVDISILRSLYESQASELGARMTAMDAATKNAKEMIGALLRVK